MITIYGINNCDVTQKAIKWLKARNTPFVFHDYKVSGIDKATLEKWLQHFPINKVANAKSTTYRSLTDAEKASITDKQKAVALMMQHNSLIKRPIWDLGDGTFFIGWDESAIDKLLAGTKK